MSWKIGALVSFGFSGGLAFAVACTQIGGLPGVDSAVAAENDAVTCAQWEIGFVDVGTSGHCYVSSHDSDSPCSIAEGWEPVSGHAATNSSYGYVLIRRCAK